MPAEIIINSQLSVGDKRTELVMSLDEIDNRRGIQENRFDFPKRFGKNHIRSSLARFT